MIFGPIILSISFPWLEYDTYMRKPKDKLGTGKHCKLCFVKNFIFSEGINMLLVLWRWWKRTCSLTSCGLKGTHIFTLITRNCFMCRFLVMRQKCLSIAERLTKMILIQKKKKATSMKNPQICKKLILGNTTTLRWPM